MTTPMDARIERLERLHAAYLDRGTALIRSNPDIAYRHFDICRLLIQAIARMEERREPPLAEGA